MTILQLGNRIPYQYIPPIKLSRNNKDTIFNSFINSSADLYIIYRYE